jgi:hypothetical protein
MEDAANEAEPARKRRRVSLAADLDISVLA